MKSIKKILQQDYITSEEYQRIKSLLSCTYIWDANTNLYKKVIEKKSKFKQAGESSGFDMRGIK